MSDDIRDEVVSADQRRPDLSNRSPSKSPQACAKTSNTPSTPCQNARSDRGAWTGSSERLEDSWVGQGHTDAVENDSDHERHACAADADYASSKRNECEAVPKYAADVTYVYRDGQMDIPEQNAESE
jgi:hypothetical protein